MQDFIGAVCLHAHEELMTRILEHCWTAAGGRRPLERRPLERRPLAFTAGFWLSAAYAITQNGERVHACVACRCICLVVIDNIDLWRAKHKANAYQAKVKLSYITLNGTAKEREYGLVEEYRL